MIDPQDIPGYETMNPGEIALVRAKWQGNSPPGYADVAKILDCARDEKREARIEERKKAA